MSLAPLVRRAGRGSDPPASARPAVAALAAVDAPGVHGEPLRTCSLEIGPGLTVIGGTDRPGSTTVLGVLAGVVRPTAGTASVLGSPLGRSNRGARVGHCPSGLRGPGASTAFELCSHLARLAGASRSAAASWADDALVAVGIVSDRDRRLRDLSGGWRRRAMIATALVGQPELLLVEEPLAGLDPAGRHQIGALLRRLAADGVAVVVSARADDGLGPLSDRVVTMRDGRVVER